MHSKQMEVWRVSACSCLASSRLHAIVHQSASLSQTTTASYRHSTVIRAPAIQLRHTDVTVSTADKYIGHLQHQML